MKEESAAAGTVLASIYRDAQPIAEYISNLPPDQRAIHALHARRAVVEASAVSAVIAASIQGVLVITEPWCGDSLAILPVIQQLFEQANVSVRIVPRDEPPFLIDRYLTRGGRAIPMVILLQPNGEERAHWGPRPGPAQMLFERAREALTSGHTKRADITRQIRRFYARDRGRTIIAEIVTALHTPPRPRQPRQT